VIDEPKRLNILGVGVSAANTDLAVRIIAGWIREDHAPLVIVKTRDLLIKQRTFGVIDPYLAAVL